MVLIFVKTTQGQTVSFDVKYNVTVKYLKKLISRSLEISRKRQKLIFGGQLLKDEETLDKYNIQKECTVQLITSNPNQSSLSSSISMSPIRAPRGVEAHENSHNNNHNKISPYLQFGDLILIQLIEAKELKKCDFWRQSSDPYVILAMDNFTTKSKIMKKNVNPKWNEMFCFVIDSNEDELQDIGKRIKKKIPKKVHKRMAVNVNAAAGSTDDDSNVQNDGGSAGSKIEHEHIVSFLVFDHDRFTPDNFLGSTEISLSLIPYDSIIDLWIPLNHIETGHLHIRIRKCLLSSPMHRSIVFKLMSLERSITVSDLQENHISLDQLVGNEAWIHGSDINELSNPALEHLVSVLLLNRDILLWKSNSLKRIQSILSSQHMLPTQGNPTRYVWFSGLASNDDSLFELIKQYVVPKRVYFGHRFALIEFKSIRDAVFIFITFQHKKIGNARVLLGFGRRLIYDREYLSSVVMAGFLSIYHENKWQLCWCFYKSQQLFCYDNLQSDEHLCVIPLALICCRRSVQSIEIISDNSSYFIYGHSKEEMVDWMDRFDHVQIEEKYNYTAVIKCSKCGEETALNDMLSTDFASSFSCIECLRSDILSVLDISHLEYLSCNYSIQDFMELLGRDQISKFLDLKLCELLESAEHFIECPSCGSKWEFICGNNDDDAPDFSRQIGMNNKLLSEEGQRHYLSHRVCCRQCNKNFCRACNTQPYHAGFNCRMYEVYLAADKCRFCCTALMPNEIAPNPPSESLKFVCSNALCIEKRDLSCRAQHKKCGHPCGGTLGEEQCMSCLYCNSSQGQAADDYCNICFTEELYEAPCIELDCGHIFHYECVRARLQIEQYYDTPSVQFGYARCPLCNMRVSHNSLLSQELKLIQIAYRDLEQRAFNQLKEDQINDQNVSYAMKRYAFYYCNICKKPYYGGLAQCRNIAQGLNPSDFVCTPCSGIGQNNCKLHGKDYMVYKCKFCCAVATYFCWGNTHFCIDCHKKQENHDFMTTKPKKDLPKCPGPDACPLGIDHPANGEEYSIGCSLCRGTEFFVSENTNPPQNDDNDEHKINND
eukprot:268877_1